MPSSPSSTKTKKTGNDHKFVASTINDQVLLLNPTLSRQLRQTKKFIIQEHTGTIDSFLLPTTTAAAAAASKLTPNRGRSKGRNDSHWKEGGEDENHHGHHHHHDFSIDSSTIQKLLRTIDRRHIHKTYNVYTSSHSSSSNSTHHQHLLCKVIEESKPNGITGRYCCDPFHKLTLHALFNRTHDEKTSLHIVYDRPYKFGGCCCQPQEMNISYFNKKDKRNLGKIQEATPCSSTSGSCLYPKFHVNTIRMTAPPTTTERMDRGDDDTGKDNLLHTTATIQSRSCCCIGGICCDEAFDVRSIMATTHNKMKNAAKIGTVMTCSANDGRSTASNGTGGTGNDSGGSIVFYVKQDVPVLDKLSLLGGVQLLQYTFLVGKSNLSSRSRCGAKLCDMYCCGCIVPCQCDCDGAACIPAGM